LCVAALPLPLGACLTSTTGTDKSVTLRTVQIVCVSRKDRLTKPTETQIASNNAALESMGARADCK
jgi:hypothetical protein